MPQAYNNTRFPQPLRFLLPYQKYTSFSRDRPPLGPDKGTRVKGKTRREGLIKVDAVNTNPAAVIQQNQPSLAALIRDGRTRFFKVQSQRHLDLIRSRFPEGDMIYAPTANANELYPTLLERVRGHRPRQVFGRDRVWFNCNLRSAHHALASAAGPNAFVQTYVPGPATDHGYVYAFEHKGQGWIKIGFTNKDEAYCWNRIRDYAEARFAD